MIERDPVREARWYCPQCGSEWHVFCFDFDYPTGVIGDRWWGAQMNKSRKPKVSADDVLDAYELLRAYKGDAGGLFV